MNRREIVGYAAVSAAALTTVPSQVWGAMPSGAMSKRRVVAIPTAKTTAPMPAGAGGALGRY
jgi:hypothetical protein